MREIAFIFLVALLVMAAQCSSPSDQDKADCVANDGVWYKSTVDKLGTSYYRCLDKAPDGDWDGGLGK